MNLCIVNSEAGFARRARKGGFHHSATHRAFSPSRIVEKGATDVTIQSVKASNVRSRFYALAEKWTRETRHLSSPTQKYLHPSYAQIIGLGNAAVPLVLNRMTTHPGDWFYALRAITGKNPVPAAMAGDLRQMTAIWLKWGERSGLI